MSTSLRLVIFDVDGTLVDSQASIVGAMAAAFDAIDRPVPDRATILSIVGLSLGKAMAQLAPDEPQGRLDKLVEAYKHAYFTQRQSQGADHAPLYVGARDLLERLHAVDEILLGIATGKSQRGLDGLLQAHGLTSMFVTRQVSDHHPSKPHPSMIQAALAETGVDAANAVMIGDTSFDMDMARAAGVPGIGVSWGYHSAATLNASHGVLDRFEDLPVRLDDIWRDNA